MSYHGRFIVYKNTKKKSSFISQRSLPIPSSRTIFYEFTSDLQVFYVKKFFMRKLQQHVNIFSRIKINSWMFPHGLCVIVISISLFLSCRLKGSENDIFRKWNTKLKGQKKTRKKCEDNFSSVIRWKKCLLYFYAALTF